jgi:hypothetical protein
MGYKPFWHFLFEGEGASDVIMDLINKGYSFSDEAILEFFELDKADEVVALFISQGRYLPEEAQNKLFKLKNAAQLVTEFSANFSLGTQALHEVFNLSEAEEIFEKYIRAHRYLPEGIQYRLFSQSKARKFIEMMIDEEYVLDEEVEAKIFQQENPFDLARRYVDLYGLRKSALKQVCLLPNSKEFLEYYITEAGYDWNGGELYLLQHPEAEHLLELYIDAGHKISVITFLNLLEKPYGERLYLRYGERNGETAIPFSVRTHYLQKCG